MKKNLKKFACLLAALAALSITIAAQSKEINRTVDFSAGGELRLKLDKTTLRLHSWERNQVEITGRIEADKDNGWKDADYTRRAVEATRVDINGDARSLSIRTNFDDVPQENWSRHLPRVYLDVRVPRNLALHLDIDRGDAELRGLEGRLQLVTDRTQLRAQDLAGELRLHVDRGGHVELTGVRARLEIETDRTEVTLRAAQITGDSSFNVSRGRIAAYLPREQKFSLSANKERRSEFQTDFALTTRVFNDSRIEGEVNGGGPRLTIQSDRAVVALKAE